MKLLIITQKYDINDSNLGAFVGWWDKLSEKIDKVYILSVGKITPSKGHDLVIKAIVDLIKAGYHINLKIIGDVIQKHHQKYADFLEKLAVDSGIRDYVEFTGAPYWK